VEVEIWSDVVCPWCFVGKRRFEAALAAFAHRDDVHVTWRSFELDPTAPREREVDLATHLAAKYGRSPEEALAMQQRMREVGAADGIEFRHDIARGGNSFDAHRLLHLAAAHDRQDALKERLLRSYHSEGEPIGDPATLERLAVEVGLPAEEVDDVLAGDRYAAEVRDDEQTAASFGISGVPFFVVNRSFAASGAQSPEILGERLSRGWGARATASAAQQA
jgi:predicted DsbA family dithiol-disulfide isomerase